MLFNINLSIISFELLFFLTLTMNERNMAGEIIYLFIRQRSTFNIEAVMIRACIHIYGSDHMTFVCSLFLSCHPAVLGVHPVPPQPPTRRNFIYSSSLSACEQVNLNEQTVTLNVKG